MPINDVRCVYCGTGPCNNMCEGIDGIGGRGPHWDKHIPEYRIETQQPYQPQPSPMPVFPSAPKGCICPPTSEQTCQRWDCGRKTTMPSQTTSGTST